MTDIYVRHHADAKAVKLGEVPLTRAAIDSIIPLLSAWGIYTDEDGLSEDLTGQFVIGLDSAYFEVVVGSDE